MRRFLEILLIVSGIYCFLFCGFLVFQRYYPKNTNIQNSHATYGINPVKISIPSLDISLKIMRSQYINGDFETISDGVSYLDITPIPGEKGNSILYGHNWTSLLGSLPQIKIGDTINIVMSNGETRAFEVKFTTTVDPSETQVLAESYDARITIYTCTGFLDSKRFVAVAFPTIQ